MDLSELNIFPKYVPCKNIECDAPFSSTIQAALALLEYMNYEKPNSTLKFTCNKCFTRNEYSFNELLKFLPTNKRPKKLPVNEVFVLILIPIKTERPMDNPAFGERVRAKILDRNDDTFFCQLLEKSLIAPTLTDKDIIYCRDVSGFIFAFDRLIGDILGGRFEPIQKIAPPKGSNFGLFFVKEDSLNNELLIPANPKCLNPSCNYIFSFTANKLKEMLKATPNPEILFDRKYLMIECPICSTNKVITEQFINSLYPV